MKSFTKFSVAGIVAVAAAFSLTGCDENGDFDVQQVIDALFEDSDTEQSGAGQSAEGGTPVSQEFSGDVDALTDKLHSLQVEDLNRKEFEERSSTYNRDDDYPHWSMATEDLGWDDGNPNCNVRWATLWRDGTDLEWDDYDTCTMADVGHWEDPYGVLNDSGEVEYLVTEDPSDLDIDHIVSLHDGHVSGLYATEPDDPIREQFANDPLNLSVSDASANRSKGDSSPADYIPPGEFRCTYAEKYILVSEKYELSLSSDDVQRLEDVLQECK